MAKIRKKPAVSKLHRNHLKSFRQENEGRALVGRPKAKFVYNPPGQIKVSDAIEQIIEPFWDDTFTKEGYERLVALATTAWNATLLPRKTQLEMFNTVKGLEVDSERQETLVDLMKALMARKRALYPNVRRAILSYQVTDLGNTFHLSVISTLPEGEHPA